MVSWAATPVWDVKERRDSAMRREKRKRLEGKGWRFGTAQEFLGLSPAEAASVEDRLRFAEGAKRRRVKRDPAGVGR